MSYASPSPHRTQGGGGGGGGSAPDTPSSPATPASTPGGGGDGGGAGNRTIGTGTGGNNPPPTMSATTFPTGGLAKRELRKKLVASTDPVDTIQTFQRTHSLHSMMARAMGTTPLHEEEETAASKSGGGASASSNTRSSSSSSKLKLKIKAAKEESAPPPKMVEPFRPDPVLTFLTHLGVSRSEVHRRVLEALRSRLLSEIERTSVTNTSKSREALLRLLRNTWAVVANVNSAPELRPVLVAVLKKLGDGTPAPVLAKLAERGRDGEPRYAELLGQVPVTMRRLVWEADVDSNSEAGGASGGSVRGDGRTRTVLEDMVRPLVEEYGSEESWNRAADLSFVGGIAERRVATQTRRTVVGAPPGGAAGSSSVSGLTSSSTLPGMLRLSSSPTKTSRVGAASATTDGQSGAAAATTSTSTSSSSTVEAIAKLREIVGDRPKLLGAVLNMLIDVHGSSTGMGGDDDGHGGSVLRGSANMHCCLVTDVLVSFRGGGKLPRQYEHVGILARLVDECVRTGQLTDDALAQIQGCLRVIYQVNNTAKASSEGGGSSATAEGNASGDTAKDGEGKKRKAVANPVGAGGGGGSPTKKKRKDDTEFHKRLLGRIVAAALASMKQSDPQSLFLNPVTDEIAPNYSSVIHEPMCMLTIQEKLTRRQYNALSEFERDVQLMYRNCITYNIGKDGTWFRGEARRQNKVFKETTLKQAKELYRREMMARRKALARAEKAEEEEEARKRREQQQQDRKRKHDSMDTEGIPKGPSQPEKGGGPSKGSRPPHHAALQSLRVSDDDAISRLRASDVTPLPATRGRRSKKDGADVPSMPALASMILADPFVVRLLLHRVLRALRDDLPTEKGLPCGHTVVPSLLQLLHMGQNSSELCAERGRRFAVPDPGLVPAPTVDSSSAKTRGGDEVGKSTDEDYVAKATSTDVSFASLRRYTPLLTKLLLDSELDRRMAPGGDLYDAALEVLPARPAVQAKEWGASAATAPPSSSFGVLRALLQGSLVHLLQPGNSNDIALAVQYPRFVAALEALLGGGSDGTEDGADSASSTSSWSCSRDAVALLLSERPFFLSVAHALLRHKARLAHGTRDLVVDNWLRWLRCKPASTKKKRKREGGTEDDCVAMTSALHEIFIYLLNEWSCLGNAVIPTDKLLSLSEEAARAVELGNEGAFARAWENNAVEFGPVRNQYERMLKGLPEDRVRQWKESVGIGAVGTVGEGATHKDGSTVDSQSLDTTEKSAKE